jgi:uncharacterized protein with von Willebrand factor type A (vWA) domain
MKKPTKKKPELTSDIIVLLDRSGSMATIQNDMVHGFAGFVKAQRAGRRKRQPGGPASRSG